MRTPRLVAELLHFFPGYTYNSILDEYAVRVFSLLAHMGRMDAEHKLTMLQMSIIPNSKKGSYETMFRGYNIARRDPIAELFFDIDKAARDRNIEKIAGFLK